MSIIVYGWIGNSLINNIIGTDLNDKEKKFLTNTLSFLPKSTPLSPGFNTELPSHYNEFKKLGINNDFVKKYEAKFSIYNKLLFLQKYLDRLNFKYAINLKISFNWSIIGSYEYILFIDNYKITNNISNTYLNQLNTYWQRICKMLNVKEEPALLIYNQAYRGGEASSITSTIHFLPNNPVNVTIAPSNLSQPLNADLSDDEMPALEPAVTWSLMSHDDLPPLDEDVLPKEISFKAKNKELIFPESDMEEVD